MTKYRINSEFYRGEVIFEVDNLADSLIRFATTYRDALTKMEKKEKDALIIKINWKAEN